MISYADAVIGHKDTHPNILYCYNHPKKWFTCVLPYQLPHKKATSTLRVSHAFMTHVKMKHRQRRREYTIETNKMYTATEFNDVSFLLRAYNTSLPGYLYDIEAITQHHHSYNLISISCYLVNNVWCIPDPDATDRCIAAASRYGTPSAVFHVTRDFLRLQQSNTRARFLWIAKIPSASTAVYGYDQIWTRHFSQLEDGPWPKS